MHGDWSQPGFSQHDRSQQTVSSNNKLALSGHQPRARPRASHDAEANGIGRTLRIVGHVVSTEAGAVE